MESATTTVQVGTWNLDGGRGDTQSLTVQINSDSYDLPLVWDEESWASQLASQDAWPDLQRCVEFYIQNNPALKNHTSALASPMPFVDTPAFWDSIETYCQPPLRSLLIKAIAKRAYGILDASLGDEAFGSVRRFRVTDFWRVHYTEQDGSLRLEQFGPHDMA